MGIFDGLRHAKVSEKGQYLNPGKYKVEIVRSVYKKTRSSGDAFIVELKVLESDYDRSVHLDMSSGKDKPGAPNRPGTTASWYQSLKDTDIGWGSMLGFFAAITGSDPKDPTFLAEVEKLAEDAVDRGALNGLVVPLEVVATRTKRDKDFSLHKWSKAIVS